MRAIGYILCGLAYLLALPCFFSGLMTVDEHRLAWGVAWLAGGTLLGLISRCVELLEQIRDELRRR